MPTPEKVIDEFFRRFPQLHYAPREVLLRPGELIPGISYLIKGTVRMFATSREGEELTLHLFRPGTFFPMIWHDRADSNPYFFEASTAVDIYRAPTEETLSFLETNPAALLSLTKRLMAGLRGMTERMTELVYGDSYGKTVSALSYLARTFGEARGKACFIDFPLTHEVLSTWVGSTRVSVSQAMSRLKKEGVISYDKGHVVILNWVTFQSSQQKPY